MDLTTLRAVLSDLRPKLLPSRFEKAQQPDPATLQLGFRSLQGMLWLELSWQADAPRLVQIPPPPRQGAGSTLSQQIQHSLRQMALIELVQTGFERVVEFRMAPRPGDAVQRVLVLEATAEPLTKVRMSGGGRCNVTHACWDPGELVGHYPRGQRPLRGPFSRFASGDSVAWFSDRGLDLWRKTMAGCFLRPIAPPRWWIASGQLREGLEYS